MYLECPCLKNEGKKYPRAQCVWEVDWNPTKPFIPHGFYMWTLQLKSMSPTTQPNNIKRHNLLILRWLRRASFSLRQCSKQQQQFLYRLSAAENEILLFYLLEKREKGGPDPTKPHIDHVTHILETKATSLSLPKEEQTALTGCEHFAAVFAWCSPPTSMAFPG